MDLEPTISIEEKMVCFASKLLAKCKPFAHCLNTLEFLLQIFYQTSSFLYHLWTLLSLSILTSLIYLIWVDRVTSHGHLRLQKILPVISPLQRCVGEKMNGQHAKLPIVDKTRSTVLNSGLHKSQSIYGIMKLILGTTPEKGVLWSTPCVFSHLL